MERYTKTAISLHWLTALLIIAAFALGVTMVDIPGLTPTKLKYFSWHKWLGITVLGIACLRLLWRLSHPAPAYPFQMPRWQQAAAHALHLLLYFLIFAIPGFRLSVQPGCRRTGGLSGCGAVAGNTGTQSRTEALAQAHALHAEHDFAGSGDTACAGRTETPFHRSRWRIQTHFALTPIHSRNS